MFRFFLLLSFTSLYAALPTLQVEHEHSEGFNVQIASEDERLITFSLDNPDMEPFSIKMNFKNNCSIKNTRTTRAKKTGVPLTSIKLRMDNKVIYIWEKGKSQNFCEFFIVDFSNNIRPFYRIELLGSWGRGGEGLLAGTYAETVKFLVIEPQPSN